MLKSKDNSVSAYSDDKEDTAAEQVRACLGNDVEPAEAIKAKDLLQQQREALLKKATQVVPARREGVLLLLHLVYGVLALQCTAHLQECQASNRLRLLC